MDIHEGRTRPANPKPTSNGKVFTLGAILGIILIGAIGGIFGFVIANWWSEAPLSGANVGDPVSIANTYIVFTTFIVAVAAIILTALGISLSGQIAKSKISQAQEAFDFLKESISTDETQGIDLIDSLLSNPEVRRYLNEKMKEEAEKQIVRLAESKSNQADEITKAAENAQNQATAAADLKNRLNDSNRRE